MALCSKHGKYIFIIFTILKYRHQKTVFGSKTTIFTVQNSPDVSLKHSNQKTFKMEGIVLNSNLHIPASLNQKRWIFPTSRKVILNKDDDVKLIHLLYGPLTLVFLTASTFSITLLPVHNVLLHPEYWYEIVFTTSSQAIICALGAIIECDILLSGRFTKSKMRICLELFFSIKITEVLLICFIHLLWARILEYYEPFPFRLPIASNLSNLVGIARAWNMVPKETRRQKELRKRCKSYLFGRVWIIFIAIQLNVIGLIIYGVPNYLQWIVPLVVPLTKEVNDRILCYFMTKSAGPKNIVEIKFIGKILLNTIYDFWLAISLAGRTTKSTGYVILVLNFFIDMSLCYKVVQLDKKVSGNDFSGPTTQNIKQQILTELMLNEIAEVVVPLAFIGSFLIGYYGPNKDILGAIGCEIWQFKKVKDLNAYLMPVVEMTLIDMVSVIFAGISLRWFCHINIGKEYCKTIKKYWTYLSFLGGPMAYAVSFEYFEIGFRLLNNTRNFIFLCIKLFINIQWMAGFPISAGVDETGEFLWIRDDEARAEMIANYTNSLSNEDFG